MLANAEDDDKVSSPRQSCEQSPSSRLADVINLFACIWQDRKHAKSDISLPTITMPIAPIVGKLRKRFFIDLTCSLGLGISGGYAYWSVCLLFCALFIMLNPSSGMATILRLVSLRCGLSMQSWHSCRRVFSWAPGELLPQARERKGSGRRGIVNRWGEGEAADVYITCITYQSRCQHSICPHSRSEPTQTRSMREIKKRITI